MARLSLSVAVGALLFALAVPATAQQPAARYTPAEPATVLYASQVDLQSNDGKAAYRIFVSEPVGPPPADGYPVVYVLDGNGYFATAVETARILEMAGEIRPALIVGVGYPFDASQPEASLGKIAQRRVFDYTPQPPPGVVVAEMGGLPVGGADDFYRFLKEELSPHLQRSYRIDPTQDVLIGHSLGGLFALDAAFKHPQAFRSVISASPSISFGNAVVLSNEARFAAALKTGKATRILVTVGGLESSATATPVPPGMSRTDFAAYIDRIRTVDNARKLGARLSRLDRQAMSFFEFAGETHVSVVPASISRGLRFALGVPAQR